MNSRLRSALATLLRAVGLGALILGGGGRLAMHAIARSTTGTGHFSLGGSVTVIALGALSGVVAGLILLAARALLRRWPPSPTIVYWLLLFALTLRGLKPLDQLRVLLFLPLVLVFGVLLQWWTRPTP